MREYLQNAVQKYCDFAGIDMKTLMKVATPFLAESKDTDTEDPDNPSRGDLAGDASKVLMTFTYSARLARSDSLRAVGNLATEITGWTKVCDKRLHRFVSHVHQTYDQCQIGWVGDEIGDLDVL